MSSALVFLEFEILYEETSEKNTSKGSPVGEPLVAVVMAVSDFETELENTVNSFNS